LLFIIIEKKTREEKISPLPLPKTKKATKNKKTHKKELKVLGIDSI